MDKLSREFYLQSTLTVAHDLIGKNLVVAESGQLKIGQITETEAYLQDDPASHSFKGERLRNQAMFLLGGYSYVYFIYGKHFCLNLVTQTAGRGEAVLIRGIIPIQNLGDIVISGPGRVCQALGITLHDNAIDTLTSDRLWVEETGLKPEIWALPRIGISQAKDKLWRFVAQAP